jgi:hypothetical protein
MLIYPKTPPEFKVNDITENSINLHYFSRDFRVLSGADSRVGKKCIIPQ